MAIKIDWSQFKKVGEDKTHTTLKHADGHELKIAHGALSPEHRKGLSKLKMAEGGELSESDLMEAKKQTDDYNKAHPESTSDYPEEVTKAMKHAHQGKLKMADGGQVSGGQSNQEKAMEAMRKAFGDKSPSKPKPKPMYADGGQIDPQSNQAKAMESIRKAFGGGKKSGMYAEGGHISRLERERADQIAEGLTPREDAMRDLPPAEISPSQSPQTMLPEIQTAGQQAPINASQAPQPGQMPQFDASQAPEPMPTMLAPGEAAPSEQQAPAGSQSQGLASPQMPEQHTPPDLTHAYEQQQAGTGGRAAAESQAAHTTESLLHGQAAGVQHALNEYQQSHKEIDNEVKNLQQDILDGHIDPNRYLGSMDTGARIQTGIALALGGLGGALHGGGNQALDFINKQIDRDIEAQRADLGKKETLLSATMRKYGNLQDATNMARLFMLAGTQTGIDAAQAKANSQIALARGQQLSGALEAQMAPLIQQSAMRSMLLGSNSGDRHLASASKLIKEDPASFVAALVPTEKQGEVAKSIDAAKNTKRMGGAIIKSFDEAAKENTVLRTGAGMLRTPASVYALHQSMQPTFADLEGTVRQAAMDNTFKNITPMPGDMDSTVARKRQSLVDYLQSKASATLPKAYGIDLEKFHDTALLPESHLGDKEKMMLELARQNPEHPKAKLIFKKLGINE